MELVYTLMMYGALAIIIFFIALLTAGIVVGTVLMVASLVRNIRNAQQAHIRVSSGRTIRAVNEAVR